MSTLMSTLMPTLMSAPPYAPPYAYTANQASFILAFSPTFAESGAKIW